MYSRSYSPEAAEKVNLPENYDGTAFMDRAEYPSDEVAEVSFNEDQLNPPNKKENNDNGILASINRVPFLSGVFGKGGLFSGINLGIPKMGTEEILILAAAAFLFFSKDGDKETAIILLLLLLIT